jgi:UDP-galactopyranose mutase
MTVDAVVIGAGVAGCTLSRLLADKGCNILMVEKRPHIAGQAYDETDAHGILVHRYGPHLFHTNNPALVSFLSQFTGWHPYEHKVLAAVDGQFVPVPFNLDSLGKLYPSDKASALEKKLKEAFGDGANTDIWSLLQSGDDDIRQLGEFVYEKIFYHYTKKQWEMEPEELNPDVLSRVPVAISRDGRYFTDPFQSMPDMGYTRLFERMICHARIGVERETPWREWLDLSQKEIFLKGERFRGDVYFTAPLDELFDFCYGELPYRSLFFEFTHYPLDAFQPACTVNYPNEEAFTRITEFKHCTGQVIKGTTVAHEYPRSCSLRKGDVPYYPIPREENAALYQKYALRASRFKNLHPVGRLAEYKYYNMAQAMEAAFHAAGKSIKP